MQATLLKKLLITVTATLAVTAIILGGGKALPIYADDGTPELVKYDIDGDGEYGNDEKAYKLETADDLYWFAGLVNGEKNQSANAFLANDITVNNGVLNEDGELNKADKDNFKEWTPIGYYDYEGKKRYDYCGTFDGGGYTISGLYFNDSSVNKVGLFGYVGPSETGDNKIKNLTVADSYFCGGDSVGGVCGDNTSGIIQNCTNTATVEGKDYVGGVCGKNESESIENCYNAGKVCGDQYVGGVCGYSVVQYKNQNCYIPNCYNTGAVSGNNYAGGICGRANYDTITAPRMIANCYNTGAVSGTTFVGCICGCAASNSTQNCHYLKKDDLKGNGALKDAAGKTEAKSSEQFASGEVCWLLNGGENQVENPAFFQKLDTNADAFPILDSKHGKVYRSSNCVVYSNDDKGNKEHSLTPAKQVDATCTKDGCKAYWYCKDCKKYFSDADCKNESEIEDLNAWKSGDGKLAALGHKLTPTAQVDATCTKDGCKAYWYCSECKTYFADKDCKTKIADLEAWKSKDGKIEKGQHKGGTATCTEKAKCEICGAEYGTVEGHKYAETWNFDAENHWHECEVCHDKKDVATHTLVTTITNAGIGVEGKIETVCTDCNNVIKTDLIPAIATVKLSQTSYTYNKKAQKPSVIVTDSEGTVIANTNYTVKYPSGRKKIGKYTVKVTFTGNYTGSVELTFTINPPKTSISKVKAGKKSFTVKWTKKTSGVTGYQIEYSTSGKFTGKTKTVTVKSAKTASKTISKLGGNKKYYVRIRTYKTVRGKKYYSDWSSKKTVKTKK